MSFFSHIKDNMTSFAGSIILKKKIERYGNMLDFRIDSENKKIFLKVSLKGEPEPLDIIIENYLVTKQKDDDVLIIERVSISKEWMNLLAVDLLKNKEFKIPKGIAGTIAKMVL